MKKLIVEKENNNKKLSKYLEENIPNITKNVFYKTLRKKDIKINGKRISEDVLVYENDEVLVYIPDEKLKAKIDLQKIYEDENILIIDKPANIEVTGKESLTEFIHNEYANCEFKPMPCHRLDRNTTGLLLYAKNKEALEILLNKFKNHEIEKHYLALVYGYPKRVEQKMIAYLFKDSKKSIVYISDEPKKGYSKIITSYSLVKKYPNNTSLLDVQIETGKTHQIRAHLAHVGLPIVGDGKYGDYDVNKKLKFKTQQLRSYKLKFNFTSDSGTLEYLRGKEIKVD